MALKKEIETAFGVPAEYWNTHDIVISLREGKVSVATNGYRDEDARRSGATPMDSKGVSLSIGPMETLPARTRRVGNPEFGGTVVEEASSFIPFIDKAAVQALQAAVYEALKTTPEFGGAADV